MCRQLFFRTIQLPLSLHTHKCNGIAAEIKIAIVTNASEGRDRGSMMRRKKKYQKSTLLMSCYLNVQKLCVVRTEHEMRKRNEHSTKNYYHFHSPHGIFLAIFVFFCFYRFIFLQPLVKMAFTLIVRTSHIFMCGWAVVAIFYWIDTVHIKNDWKSTSYDTIILKTPNIVYLHLRHRVIFVHCSTQSI